MSNRVLVHKDTGVPVQKGERLVDFRGDEAFFVSSQEGIGSSSGRCYVIESRDEDEANAFGYYPSVFDLEWREVEA
jgi:hypothetical protein